MLPTNGNKGLQRTENLKGIDANLALADVTASIAENSPAGTSVTNLTATGGTAPYTYSLSATSDLFEVDNTDDKLKVKTGAVLDFENASSYTITVKVEDQASGSADATFTIQVTNVNEPPVFSPATYSENENNSIPAGSTIVTVTATDPDSGAEGLASYAISSGNVDTTFEISNAAGTKGKITLANGKMITQSFTLVVHALDGGDPVLTGTATVSLLYPSGAASKCITVLLLIWTMIFHAVNYFWI